MAEQEEIQEALGRVVQDISFLKMVGALPQSCGISFVKQLRRQHDSLEKLHGPLQVNQPPLRPESPMLLDLDSEISGDNNERQTLRNSSVPSVRNLYLAPPAGSPYRHPSNVYDLDQHERDGAAEWGGTGSSLSEKTSRELQGLATPSLVSEAGGGVSIRGRAGKRLGSHGDDSSRFSINDQHVPRRSTQQVPNDQPRPQESPEAPAQNPAPERIICPYWLSDAVCTARNCHFEHDVVRGLPLEKLECREFRLSGECNNNGCIYEHQATIHGICSPQKGRKLNSHMDDGLHSPINGQHVSRRSGNQVPYDPSQQEQAQAASSRVGPPATRNNWAAAPASAAERIICPYWLTKGVCDKAFCTFEHKRVEGLPLEKLECWYRLRPGGCIRSGCIFEHQATVHGISIPPPSSRGRKRR